MSKLQILRSTGSGRAADPVAPSTIHRGDRGSHPPPAAAMADPEARDFLRKADPVLARLIDARPDFRPRLDGRTSCAGRLATLIFQVAGQQLSVSSTRAIISHLQQRIRGPHAVAGGAACGRPKGPQR